MLNWLADKFQSGMNFLGQIGESSAFKATSFIGKLLFGIPLGAVRLLAFDLPLHVGVSVAKWSHTRFYKALGYGETTKTIVDPFYASLSEWANSTTSSFVKGFMFGPYLQIANKIRTTTEDWQEENYGNAPKGGNIVENFAAKTGGETAKKVVAEELLKQDMINIITNPLPTKRGSVDVDLPSTPTSTIRNGMTVNPIHQVSPSHGRSTAG